MKQEQGTSRIPQVLVLAVFAVFAVCVLLVLLTGADLYQGLTRAGQEEYAHRTAAQYITTRVRQGDRADSIRVEDFGGTPALILRDEIEGESYETRLYCHDGYLRELFCSAPCTLAPEDGEPVLALQGLEFIWDAPVLTARIVPSDGAAQTMTWYLRSGEEARP